jgi:hypothetical protein
VASRPKEGLVPILPRCLPRIQPPSPITVVLEDGRGTAVAYGVVSDISKRGGCIHTDVLIVNDATFNLRLSLSSPPEVHTVRGRIAWARPDPECPRVGAYCCGIEWLSLGYTLRCRLRQLTTDALRSASLHRFILDKKRVKPATAPSPKGRLPVPQDQDPETGPQTRPFAVTQRAGAARSAAGTAAHGRAGILSFPQQGLRSRRPVSTRK